MIPNYFEGLEEIHKSDELARENITLVFFENCIREHFNIMNSSDDLSRCSPLEVLQEANSQTERGSVIMKSNYRTQLLEEQWKQKSTG